MARTRAFNTPAPSNRSGVFGSVRGNTSDRASPGLQQSRQARLGALAGRTGGGFAAPRNPRALSRAELNKRRQQFTRRVGLNVNSRRNRPAPVGGGLRDRQQPFPRAGQIPQPDFRDRGTVYRPPVNGGGITPKPHTGGGFRLPPIDRDQPFITPQIPGLRTGGGFRAPLPTNTFGRR